jgi:hypothetical protein
LMMECLHQESSKKKKKKSRAAYPQGDWAIPGARAIEAF